MERRRLSMKPRALFFALGGAAVFLAAGTVGSLGYFHFGPPAHTCASCHEMGGVHSEWSASAHRSVHCRSCHGGSLTLNLHALEAHANRVVRHLADDLEAPVRLTERDRLQAHAACRDCHPESYAAWANGPHSANYARIFLTPEHHRVEHPADDCLRCHGMFFEGGIETLLTPVNREGPWTLRSPEKAAQPTIPCLACHQIHTTTAGPVTPAVHFYDCREGAYFHAADLPAPLFREGERPVRHSSDPRQRVCVQCHAPSAALAHQVGTSDDRTPLGVHEGLSCLDCHAPHSSSARASCKACHGSMARSNCGLDVERMDTTFRDPASRHNVHTVSCRDCHPEGRPAARPSP
jgi:hypothetical protein